MATVLDQYNDLKGRIGAKIAAGQFPPDQMLQYQEMLYRIDVLETCIISELTMAIMMKYDPTRIPRKKKQL